MFKYKVGDKVKVRVLTDLFPEVKHTIVETTVTGQLIDLYDDPQYQGSVSHPLVTNNFYFWESDVLDDFEEGEYLQQQAKQFAQDDAEEFFFDTTMSCNVENVTLIENLLYYGED